jgi:cytochrome P450
MQSLPHTTPPQPEPSWHGVDPTQPDAMRWEDPFPSLCWLREHAPVNETPAGLWRLFRYRDCVRVLRELPSGVRRTDGTSPGDAMGGAGPSGGQFMLQQDPPNHTRLRKLVSKAFTPRAAEHLRPRAREIVSGLVDAALEARELDVVSDLALPLPSQLICEMLGVPLADRARFTEWTSVATHLLRGRFLEGAERERVEQTAGQLASYFEALIAERRKQLGPDLLSTLIRAEEEGDQLSPEELLIQSIGLLVAGFETTIGLISLGVKNLIDHPAELARLRADSGLLASAVEECLRYEGPIGMTTRVLHVDAEFDGRVIPKDTTVWLSLWSADRDPEVFPEPERFDAGRRENPHLAFGGGTHHCLGAHLARMEAQEAIGALVARTRHLEREGDPLAWGASVFRVPARLHVSVEPA